MECHWVLPCGTILPTSDNKRQLQSPAAGTARLFLWDGAQAVGDAEKKVQAGRTTLTFKARTSATGAADSLTGTKASPVLAVSLEAEHTVFATRAARRPLGLTADRGEPNARGPRAGSFPPDSRAFARAAAHLVAASRR